MNVTKTGKTRRTNVSSKAFITLYKPMADAGKSAKEIAVAMTEAFKQTYGPNDVSLKASQLRAGLKENGIAEDEVGKLVPYLASSGGGGAKNKSSELIAYLRELATPEVTAPVAEGEAETTAEVAPEAAAE